MVIVQGILTFLSRSVGKILNTAFGWAIQMLYGRVPQNNQTLLSGIAFGSVLWLVTLIGIVYPPFGVWLLTFVPLPNWVNDNWVRLAMLLIAAALPLVIGVLAKRLDTTNDDGTKKQPSIWDGYGLTAGLAVTLIMLTVVAPILHLRALAKRWDSQRIPVIIETGDYCDTLNEIENALKEAGWSGTRQKAGLMLTLPLRAQGFFTRRAHPHFIAEHLSLLVNETQEILVHPSYLSLSGPAATVASIRALLVEHLTFSPAHTTWDKEAMEVEDRLEALWNEMENVPPESIVMRGMPRLREIKQEVRHLSIPYEEWEALYRVALTVERAMLRASNGQPPFDYDTENVLLPADATADSKESLVRNSVPALAGTLAVFAAFFGTLWMRRSRR